MNSLQNTVIQQLSAAGWKVRSDGSSVSAEREDILGKWFLGTRSVKLHTDLQFDEPENIRIFGKCRGKTIGLPPPAFSVSTTTQSGIQVNERRTDVGSGGGGTMEYGRRPVDRAKMRQRRMDIQIEDLDHHMEIR